MDELQGAGQRIDGIVHRSQGLGCQDAQDRPEPFASGLQDMLGHWNDHWVHGGHILGELVLNGGQTGLDIVLQITHGQADILIFALSARLFFRSKTRDAAHVLLRLMTLSTPQHNLARAGP